MKPTRPKIVARAGLALCVGVVALLVLSIASASVRAVGRSDQRAEIFNDAGLLPADLTEGVTWRPDANRATRPIEPLTRDLVAASWLRAWEQLRIVSETGDTSGVAVSFSNDALDDLLAGAGDWGSQSIRQQRHDLEVTFYSDDGQILGLTSHATELVHTTRVGDRSLERRSVEAIEAVLVLEDGSWRIHHLVRRSVDLEPWRDASASDVATS